MRFILIVCFLVNCCESFAQANLSGKVVSSADNSPIVFATVYLKKLNIGAYTNDFGKFEFTIPDSTKDDTLVISQLGYVTKSFKLKDILSNGIRSFQLSPASYMLEPVQVVVGKGDIEAVGKISSKVRGYSRATTKEGYQLGRLISLNEYKGKRVKLKSIKYFITKRGEYKAPFRVRLYELNDSTGLPGKDLLTTQVVISARKKSAWATAKLDTMNIWLTSNSVVAAMEWLPIYDEYRYDEDWGYACENCYGQVIGLTVEIPELQYFTKADWHHWVRWKVHGPMLTNPMIYIEVEVFD